MENDRLMQIFATVAAEPRYFLARYILDPEEAMTTTEIRKRIEGEYPYIFNAFFVSRGPNYAWQLCAKLLHSIGLTGETLKKKELLGGKTAIDARAIYATGDVEEIAGVVHGWWDKELHYRFHASQFLSHHHVTKKEPLLYRALMVRLLPKTGAISIKDVARELFPLYKKVTEYQNVKGDMISYPGQSYGKIHRHMLRLEELGAVDVSETRELAKARVKMTTLGKFVAEEFINPFFAAIPESDRSFSDPELFQLLHMYYTR